ncbi:hypothetical protein AOQ84DRAFT_287775 [Glonium stellatum]|uniref:Uncharacterized protein n=1 Tax=Glonium stellatum TaxID=574774 RepID=A0A8E2JVJ0_9PEZI|nr:hypothetical protein AOQ84DRAFT_287775 [Glonium stellatum]
MTLVTDWISAVCSALAAFVALLTLLAVFVSARQLLTEHSLYRLGLAEESLGPWHSKVERKRFLGMQRHICTPTVTLPDLVQKDWKPNVTFPVGFSTTQEHRTADPERALVKASWVNFMEALGLSPKSEHLYKMNLEPELVNGIIPMRWNGKDLVGICSMLGFQSHEDKPSFKTPMPLPMQWSGPLGWLQFRASSDGCICEFRRRMILENQLSSKTHQFYKDKSKRDHSHMLKSRLWQSINGMSLRNNQLLYLGGTDGDSATMRTSERHDQSSQDNLFEELLAADLTQEEVVEKIGGGRQKQLDILPTKNTTKEADSFPEFFRNMLQKKKGKMEVLKPCPGLLSVVVEGELAYSRGLDIRDCHEYHRTYTDYEDVDQTQFPYHLGDLYMDETLLKLMKEAMATLKPDGFYFSPTAHLYSDITEVYKHVQEQSDKLSQIFPKTWFDEWLQDNDDNKVLYHAAALCNEFQDIRTNSRAVFTVDDMLVISKASASLGGIISTAGMDLVWAMLAQPELFSHFTQRLPKMRIAILLQAKVTCAASQLDCTTLMESAAAPEEEKQSQKIYSVPLCSNGEFSGTQLLAAFMDVFLTFFWVEKRWMSDVALYDATVPQTIAMR